MAGLDLDEGAGAWGGALAAVVFGVHVSTAASTPYLLDSAELAAAGFGLGVAHPPGEALALLWGKLFTLIPVGSVAFRVGVSQAAAGAAAAWLVFALAWALIARVDTEGILGRGPRGLLAGTTAIGFGLAPGVVLSSNRPEVYALASALALGALAAAGSRDPRGALLGALLLGLGVTNHPFVAGLAGLGAVAAALPLLLLANAPTPAVGAERAAGGGSGGRGRLVGMAVAAFLVGLAVLAYLPARAAALYAAGAPADAVVWGDARSGAGFWWIVSGRTFLAKSSIVHTGSAPEVLPFVVAEEIGLPLALLAVAGLLHLLRGSAARPLGVPLAIALAGSALAAVGAGFDPHNPDIRGYLGVALAAAAILGAAGLAALVAPTSRRLAATVAAGALAVATALHVLPVPAHANLHRAEAADLIAHELLAQAPPRAALLTSHFETAFLLAYHRLVEGRRPDAAWVHLGSVRGPGYAERIGQAHPELAPALAAHRAGTLSPEALLSLPRPVRIEPDDHLPPALRARLAPAGHLWKVAAEGATAADGGLTPVSADVRLEALRDRQVRGFVGWRAYLDGTLACRLGLTATATHRLRELNDLLPLDERAQRLLTACPTPR